MWAVAVSLSASGPLPPAQKHHDQDDDQDEDHGTDADVHGLPCSRPVLPANLGTIRGRFPPGTKVEQQRMRGTAEGSQGLIFGAVLGIGVSQRSPSDRTGLIGSGLSWTGGAGPFGWGCDDARVPRVTDRPALWAKAQRGERGHREC
jgi:hypothetical protein